MPQLVDILLFTVLDSTASGLEPWTLLLSVRRGGDSGPAFQTVFLDVIILLKRFLDGMLLVYPRWRSRSNGFSARAPTVDRLSERK